MYNVFMPRAALSLDQIAEFRSQICASATRLFAENGYDGVTLRALASSLGCSPMTPYRYFANKAEIFDTVRRAAAERLADCLDRAVVGHREHSDRLRALCHAYVEFAVAEPHAYRIMFELDRSARPESLHGDDLRPWFVMHAAVTEAVRDGALDGEPNTVAHLLWSGVHGIVALHLSGMLALGLDLAALVEAFIERELGPAAVPTRPSRASDSP